MHFIDAPRVVDTLESDKGVVVTKIVYLSGTHEEIQKVLESRRVDSTCRQLPKEESYDVAARHYLRVFYHVNVDGPHIDRIDIKIGSKWSYLYDSSFGRIGVCEILRGHVKDYYLEDAHFIFGMVSRWEDAQALHRLAHAGPGVFAEEDEDDAGSVVVEHLV